MCRRFFVSPSCYQKHLASGICGVLQACADCGKVHHTYNQHVCGRAYCKVCKSVQEEGHLCYIRPLPNEEADNDTGKKKKTQKYIFYDFECMVGAEGEHVPNLCVVQKVCQDCMQEPINVLCKSGCSREQMIFRGEDTLDQVGNWLFSGRNKGTICIAHNARGYDAHLLLQYVHENGFKPEVIQNGKKIMSMDVLGLRFIDSLNYFNTALANLPKTFGLEELHKGFFPHLFSTPANQQYRGVMPDVKFYDPDGMKEDKRREFLAWYSRQTEFDFQTDLTMYCISDVDILRRCCGKFRELFLDYTGHVEPFTKSITIASACNRVYRTLFLEDEQVAIIPPQGYGTGDRQSAIAICWMDWVARQEGKEIQHAMNGGERRVEGMKIDGVDQDGDLYEFNGCFFHGCPECFPKGEVVNPVNGLTMTELHQKTMGKMTKLRDKGHTVIEKSECKFRAEMAENEELRDFYKQYVHLEPIQPRDAFYGGRTNATRLFYEPSEGETIRYVDYTSLYPYICKYGQFPLGHPKTYYGEGIPDHVDGLMKCKVVPPHTLFHPILPYRCRGKLLFPLCRTCAETSHQGPCPHSDEERALVGTWVTLELHKAVEMGYKIVDRYAVLHFDEMTQYNPHTQEGGIWANYINLWLREKQMADGYPSSCATEEEKQRYIDDYKEHEGIQLDPEKITRNEGLRSLSKIMLNTHWGKFGQNPDKAKMTYISDPEEYIEMMTDSTIDVTDIMYVNKEHVALRWCTKGDFLEALPNTNVVLAAYTTAQARLRLYSLLERLDERALYFDTDSVIYIHDPSKWNPPLGDYLGELKDETKGVPITSYVSAGAKNYGYQLQDGNQVCKIRGFTLNHRNSLILNFDSIKELITTHDRQNDQLEVDDPHKIVRKEGHLYNKAEKKKYRLVYDKRWLLENLSTLPFGWKE